MDYRTAKLIEKFVLRGNDLHILDIIAGYANPNSFIVDVGNYYDEDEKRWVDVWARNASSKFNFTISSSIEEWKETLDDLDNGLNPIIAGDDGMAITVHATKVTLFLRYDGNPEEYDVKDTESEITMSRKEFREILIKIIDKLSH